MDNRWSDEDCAKQVEQDSARGVNRDLAELVYASRLLGRNPQLVLHGGGNTSVKTTASDVTGTEIEVLCVKGSGWDLADIESEGLPAVRLDPLRVIAEAESLSDEAMVNALRCNLLDSGAPTPSVETLLHATLPHTFILHTHANAIVALTDQPDGESLSREVFGDRVVHIPYIMPGFVLSRAVMQAGCRPEHEGMILLKHGIFSFGQTAREAYDRMIELVTLAEQRLQRERRTIDIPRVHTIDLPGPEQIAPILRGLTAKRETGEAPAPFIFEFRDDERIRDYLQRPDLERLSRAGVATPDHVIRTKRFPLLLPRPDRTALDEFTRSADEALKRYIADYSDSFIRCNAALPGTRTMLDPMPRVVLVPGLGLFGLGKTAREARIVADLAEATIDVITDAEAIGRFESINETETFEIEYWSLEQAKLSRAVEKPLTRRIVAVTGGAGTIGRAIGAAFAAQGAEIVLLDVDEAEVRSAAESIGGLGLRCDVTKLQDVRTAFEQVSATYGGVDIVISNAGAAWQGTIGTVDEATLRASFELNFFAHQTVAQQAVRIMRAQGLGGVLLFNVSKQAVNPGRDFGPYGLPKAATLALVRQYALDHGGDGIRSNGVNADRIRSGMLSEDMIRDRARARQVTETDYMSGNLLGCEVQAHDVAEAFVSLAKATKTTGAILTVDGGNIPAALR